MSVFGAQLGDTPLVTDLIPGDPDAIEGSAGGLATLAEGFLSAGRGLSQLDTGEWSGKAADAYFAFFRPQPGTWTMLGTALGKAADALLTYAPQLRSAQADAHRAIVLYAQGQQQSQAAQNAYNNAVGAYMNSGGTMPAPGVFVDPGTAAKNQAQQILTTARARLNDAAAVCQSTLVPAQESLPAQPSGLSRLGDDIEDTAGMLGTQIQDAGEGALSAVGGMWELTRAVNPFDPYNLTHPSQFVSNLGRLVDGVGSMVAHPGPALKTMVQWDTWAHDPGRAIGTLLPSIAAGAVTGGAGGAAGAAVDGLSGGLIGAARLAAGAVGKVAGTLGRGAADGTLDGAADAAGVAAAGTATGMSAAGNLDHALSGFDHEGYTVDLHDADTNAAAGIDAAGAGLGRVDADLAKLHLPAATASTVDVPSAADAPPDHWHAPDLPHGSTPSASASSECPPEEVFVQSVLQGPPTIDRVPETPISEADAAPDHAERDPSAGRPHSDVSTDTAREPSPGNGVGRGRLSDDPAVRRDLADNAVIEPDLSVLDNRRDPFVWRRGGGLVYRMDDRATEVFQDGFEPWNMNNTDLRTYAKYNDHSAFVSTSANRNYWQIGTGKYFYRIDARGGIDVNATLGTHRYAYENEIAHLGGLRGERIVDMAPVYIDPVTMKRTLGEPIPNPYYRPLR